VEIRGTGAYGHVVVARWLSEGCRTVAIKVLRRDHMRQPKIMARTRDEARMLFRLRHPHIVRVEQLVEHGGRPCFVMEWVDGASLCEVLKKHGPLPAAVAVHLCDQTATALAAAWGTESDEGAPLRVIHRDIKPGNLLVSLAGELKVVDFGVARGDFADREASTQSTILGTRAYMAPERLRGHPDTAAVDVFGLGVTLFELVTGQVLSVSRRPDLYDTRLEAYTATLRDVDLGGVSAELGSVIRQMCALDPDARPEHRQVHQLLRGLLEGTEPPDMVAWAAEVVVPLVEQLPKEPVADHPDYAELAFLEEPWESAKQVTQESSTSIPLTRADSAADRRVRRFLATKGWYDRSKELTWLLATESGWTERPFLDVLRDVPSWWQFWRRGARRKQVVAALQMLRYRKTPEVLNAARAFARHRDPLVAGAARSILVD